MATRSKSDEELLEKVTERLVDGFTGVRNLFVTNDPVGQECVTPDALRKIMYQTVGHVTKERFERMLQHLGLDKKETISFDIFVSRFKEFADIQSQWTPPLQREAEAARLPKAHPEENLRDSEIYEWAQLKRAAEAIFLFRKALREKKIDLRSVLPDECYDPPGVLTKVQMRVALKEIGVNLTNEEYRKFWAHYDNKDVGSLPMKRFYTLCGLDQNENPLPLSPKPAQAPTKPATPTLIHPPTTKGVAPPRNPAKAAREFTLGRHEIRGDPWHLEDGIRGEGIQSPGYSGAGGGNEESPGDAGGQSEEKPESPAREAEARGKIRAVINQRQSTKFDCVIDCLHHKFEERYISMAMAFKLFDIHDNGSVMRIDFRRVLREFGFPITALRLGHVISRLSMSIKHGMISYRQLMNKLMNRRDAFTSTVLDNYISAVEDGKPIESLTTTEESDVEEVCSKLVQFLHQDYVKMAAELLRKDNHRQGSLPPGEVRAAVDKCLQQTVSDSQWEQVMTRMPLDEAGNILYGDFMMSFDQGEPGTWNLQHHGIVTVPKNKVVNNPTEEVKRLQRAKADTHPVAPAEKTKRTVEQLRKELKQFFTDNLHTVDFRYKELDRKSHKRFSKWQFGSILKLCGFPMTEKELNDVWMTIKVSDDNMSTFNAVVMEFAPNFTPFLGHDKDKEEGGAGEERKEEAVAKGMEEKGELEMAGIGEQAEIPGEVAGSLPVTPKQYLVTLLTKARPSVKKHWEKLRQSFRNQDPHGFGTVSFQTLQRTLDGLRCGLTKEERDQLCAQFDIRSNGRCNYLAFMRMFSDHPPAEPKYVYAAHRHKLQRKPSDAPKPITVSEAMHRIRDKLLKHWKNLRRAFQKHDRSRSGQMTVADFKRVLAECKVPVTENDLFHILSEFDSNMNGKISYPEFLDALLRMDALVLE